MDILDFFQHDFFINAILGSLFASIACGIIGTYIVVRRLVFIGGGITHTSLGGIGLGFYFGINPIVSAMFFSILSAIGIEWLSIRQDVRKDSAIATFWSFGMAIGIIFTFLKPGYAPNLTEYLLGSILTITKEDILSLAILSFVLIAIFSVFNKRILYTAFDPEFARTRKFPVKLIEYTMMVFIAITIVLSIRLVGIMLLMSLLTVPQMTANLFTSNFNKMILLSIFLGLLGCLTGLILTCYINVPSGAFIIFVQIILFLICKLIVTISQKRSRHIETARG